MSSAATTVVALVKVLRPRVKVLTWAGWMGGSVPAAQGGDTDQDSTMIFAKVGIATAHRVLRDCWLILPSSVTTHRATLVPTLVSQIGPAIDHVNVMSYIFDPPANASASCASWAALLGSAAKVSIGLCNDHPDCNAHNGGFATPALSAEYARTAVKSGWGGVMFWCVPFTHIHAHTHTHSHIHAHTPLLRFALRVAVHRDDNLQSAASPNDGLHVLSAGVSAVCAVPGFDCKGHSPTPPPAPTPPTPAPPTPPPSPPTPTPTLPPFGAYTVKSGDGCYR